MKHLIKAFLLVSIFHSIPVWGSVFHSKIGNGDLVIFMPSINTLQTISGELLARFYGPNFTQMLEQIKLSSKENYGVDIYSDQSLTDIGVDINQPVAFVHYSSRQGYLMISLNSEEKFKAFIAKKYKQGLYYRISDSTAYLSAQKSVIDNISNLLVNDKSFNHTINKKKFVWNKPMVWANGKYLAEMSKSEGVTTHLDLPPAFLFFTVDSLKDQLQLDIYSGAMSSDYLNEMRSLTKSGGKGKFDMLDFAWGNPAIIGHTRLDVPSLYRYLLKLDKIKISGLENAVSMWKDEYNIDLYNDLILHTDGRIKLVVNEFDTKNKRYDFYASFGINDRSRVQVFVDSLKNAILKKGAKLYAFEIFTNPVYHYKYQDIDLYFGVIEDSFFVSSHKDTFIRVVKNIFEDKLGYLDSVQEIVSKASSQNELGYYFQIDVQSLLSGIKPRLIGFNADILTGIKNILIYGYPDRDPSPIGWSSKVIIDFYQ